MALKDRDYMKRWGRNDPYHNQLDLGPPGSERIVATEVGERRGRPRLGMRWPFQLLALLVIVAAASALVAPHWSSVKSAIRRVDQQLPANSTPASAFGSPSNVMHIQWHQGLTTPASAPTIWWINTPDGKRVQITVSAGETPLVALTRALAAQGWRAVFP